MLPDQTPVTLSGELATLIAGRYIEIPMLPLSFQEFLAGSSWQGSLPEAYNEYLQRSSFPYTLHLTDQEQIEGYLSSIYDSIVARDISMRHSVSDPQRMLPVLAFLMDSIGNRISLKRIADTLESSGRKTNIRTVEKFVGAFLDSYVLYQARRFDVKGRKYLRTQEKYYAVDLGPRRLIGGRRPADASSVLENVVYLELRRRGYAVYTGKSGAQEIDFVAMKPGETRYYQVSATVRDPAVLHRELLPLQQLRDHYPKRLLVLDQDPPVSHNGIEQINALTWLADPALD